MVLLSKVPVTLWSTTIGQWKTQKEMMSKFLNVCYSEQGDEVLQPYCPILLGYEPEFL